MPFSLAATKGAETFKADYLDIFVHGAHDHAAYLARIGGETTRASAHNARDCSRSETFNTALLSVRRTAEQAMAYKIKVNGDVKVVDVDGDKTLLWVLRDVLGLTGTKFGCGKALCGACTVHLEGFPTRSCVTPIESVGASAVTTIEAIGATSAGKEIQRAWLDLDVVQCGYCQSGQIMSAAALLAGNPHPTEAEIDDAMSGNICRCGTYVRIREAIKRAAQSIGQRW